jgi:hypothetical protein
MFLGDRTAGVRSVGQFGGCVGEGATTINRFAARLGENVEESQQPLLGLLGRPTHAVGEVRPPLLTARLKVRRDQFVLGTEVGVERRLGRTRLSDDGVRANGVNALAVEKRTGNVENTVARRDWQVAGWHAGSDDLRTRVVATCL